MADNTVTGIVTHVERLGTTYWGNPMHNVTLDGISTFRISDNASLNYAIDNAEYRNTSHVFVLTRAGRISHDLGATE